MKISSFGDRDRQLSPDLVFDPAAGVADLALAGFDALVNPAGLKSEAAIMTAVVMCLFTDRRVEPFELRSGDVNRGWPGDAFDLRGGDYVLGSRLWLLRRRALTGDIEKTAEDYAHEALLPLVEQGLFASFTVTAQADRAQNRLSLDVMGAGRDGAVTFNQRFQILWDQIT